MTEPYPTPPSYRMAYDVDGTKAFRFDRNMIMTELTQKNLSDMNNESTSPYYNLDDVSGGGGAAANAGGVAFAFPELRDLYGFFSRLGGESTQVGLLRVDVSSDTTNLVDGAWTSLFENIDEFFSNQVSIEHQTDIKTITAEQVRALRIVFKNTYSLGRYARVYALHLYGEISLDQSVEKLELWHPTEDIKVPVGYLDWGNQPRESSGSKQFRVKNTSTTRTATDIIVSLSALTDTTPSILSYYALSSGGAMVSNDLGIGVLAPGEISAPIDMTYTLDAVAALGWVNVRVHATPTGWS